MATITRENVAPLTDKITVALAKEDYYPQFEKSLKAYAKKANMQGFRPGQVPQGLVKKMYGQGIFTEEVLKMVEKEVNGYLTEQNPEIFAQPLPVDDNSQAVRKLDMNRPEELSFSFEIGLKPEVHVADLSQASIKRHRVIVTDEMVNQEIEYYQEKAGKQSDVEAVENDNNLLTLHLKENVTAEEGAETPVGIDKDETVWVKDFSENTRPSLIGLKKGDTLTVTLNEAFTEETLNWLLKNLKLENTQTDKQFTLTIKEIKYTEKHPLDEELFNQVFPGRGFTNEEDFRAEVKKSVEAYWDQQGRGQVDDAVYHYLLDHTTIDLPEGFLKKWIQQGGEKPKTAEEAEQSWPSFKNSLKWTLISDTLSKQYGIDVEEEDIREHALRQVMGYMGGQGNMADMPWLEGYIDKMTKDKKFVEGAYNEIATGKLFNQLSGQVQFQDEWLSREDFIKQQEDHREHHHH
jgi:trigger factor